MLKDFRVVFMGTPDFAVSSLDALVTNGYNVVGVITMPDKPSGRGQQLQYSSVKEYALSHQLPLLQPVSLKDPSFIDTLRSWHTDVQVVVAFRMLPEIVWSMPKYGTFNLHAALLPQYRGAAPINWTIIHGDTQTGLTTFLLDKDIDTGAIIYQEPIAIGVDETFGELYERMQPLGASLVCKTLDSIILHADKGIPLPTTVQPTFSDLRPAPKITKEMCAIDFSQSTEAIRNFVRGLCPVPCAFAEHLTIKGHPFEHVKIYKVSAGEGLINVPCGDGMVSIDILQLPGKRRMTAHEVLNGIH